LGFTLAGSNVYMEGAPSQPTKISAESSSSSLHRTQLVLEWVVVCRRANHLDM